MFVTPQIKVKRTRVELVAKLKPGMFFGVFVPL